MCVTLKTMNEKIPNGWNLVKFGDIATHISKRVEPSETDLNIYVGLEHIDPDNLKIKRHGVPGDVEGQKLLVRKGQIIFGKRRAYQRKLAVADWDCICSAHAMVLEENQTNILADFLPFFMQSDIFMNRAVAISEGSLSPTIKWKVLAQQEFLIPNKDNQRKLLKVLSKNSDTLILAQASLALLEKVKFSLRREVFNVKNKIAIDNIAVVKTGATPRRDNPKYWNGNIPWMSSGEVHKKILIQTDELISKDGLQNSNASFLPINSVMLAMNGQGKTRGSVAITAIETTCNQSIAAIICDERKINPMFLFFYLESQYSEIRALTGEGRNGLNLKIVRSIQVPNIESTLQEKIVSTFSNIMNSEKELLRKVEKLKDLNRTLLSHTEL
jgi:type I restriction enzyme S subunit